MTAIIIVKCKRVYTGSTSYHYNTDCLHFVQTSKGSGSLNCHDENLLVHDQVKEKLSILNLHEMMTVVVH